MAKEIELRGAAMKAIVDDEDYELVSKYRWAASLNGNVWYARTNVDSTQIYMHRLILNPPRGVQTDHINGDGLDNRRSNLRAVTNQQNSFGYGKKGRRGKASSRYKGVSWNKNAKKWFVIIKKDGKQYYLGLFVDEEEAARAYDAKAKELFGEYAYLNFPDAK